MTATEELRRLLDERGVKWTDFRGRRGVTAWMEPAGTVRADEYDAGLLLVERVMTPEQAIEATLGRGTCKLTQTSWDDGACTWGCICSACDAHLEHETGIGYNFCPICGAKVVES